MDGFDAASPAQPPTAADHGGSKPGQQQQQPSALPSLGDSSGHTAGAETAATTATLATDSNAATVSETTETAFSAAHSVHAALASRSATPPQLHLLSSSVQALYSNDAASTSSLAPASVVNTTAEVAAAASAPPSSPSSSPSASGLSRQQFHSLISQIRQAAAHFAQTSPALQLASGDSQHQGPPQPSQLLQPPPSAQSSAASNAVRRYVSLLGETSKHIAELRHSIDSFSPRHTAQPPSPVQAHIAAATAPSLAHLRSLSSRRPAHDPAAAIEALDALCAVLDSHARALGLETFAEKAQSDGSSQTASEQTPETLIHTLTIGAKILVIDVELVLLRRQHGESNNNGGGGPLAPLVKLKLSYANESSDHTAAEAGASPTRDPSLAVLLQRDVQIAADLVFQGQQKRRGARAPQHVDRVADCFARLGANLEALVNLDEVAAKVHEANLGCEFDVFDSMQRLSTQVQKVASAERRDAAAAVSGETASADRLLLERGHGIASVHQDRPFLQVTYARDEVGQADYRLNLVVKPLNISAAASGPSSSSARGAGSCSWTLGGGATASAAATFAEVQREDDPALTLGHLASMDSGPMPLRFVAQLDPPVVVMRATAAKLAMICGLPYTGKGAPSLSGTGSQVPMPDAGAIWFEDVLASVWVQRPAASSPSSDYRARSSFILARTADSSRDPASQGLIVDALPFFSGSHNAETPGADAMDVDQGSSTSSATANKTVARLFAALETLRDEVRSTELARSAVASTLGNANSKLDVSSSSSAAPTQEDLLLDEPVHDAATASTPATTIPVVISWRSAGNNGVEASATVPDTLDAFSRMLLMDLGFNVDLKGAKATATQRPRLDVRVCISPVPSTNTDWTVEVNAKLHDGDEEAPSPPSKKLAVNDPEAQQMAELLSRRAPSRFNNSSSSPSPPRKPMSGLEALDRIVVLAVEWSEAQFGVQADIPDPSGASNNADVFDPLTYEEKNVHAVYETIAPHFSSTRYKPWPLIPLFLATLPPGSLGADLGCGNGKYLPLRSILSPLPSSSTEAMKQKHSLLTIGIDRSSNLLGLARTNFGLNEDSTSGGETRVNEVAIGDAMTSGLRSGIFDYAISIATIHHFSTLARRIQTVQELIRLVRPRSLSSPSSPSSPSPPLSSDGEDRLKGGNGHGRFMIFAWALEQKDEGKRQFEALDEREKGERVVKDSGLKGGVVEQDLLVPWVLTQPKAKKDKGRKAGRKVEESLEKLDISSKSNATTTTTTTEEAPVYQRYYHVFKSGELESLVSSASQSMVASHRRSPSGRLERVQVICEVSGWERGNWWGVWRVEWLD